MESLMVSDGEEQPLRGSLPPVGEGEERNGCWSRPTPPSTRQILGGGKPPETVWTLVESGWQEPS